MSRRADPDRIYEARRSGVRNRLIGDGIPEEWAEEWIAAWEASDEAQSSERHSGGYWDQAARWIAAARSARQRAI